MQLVDIYLRKLHFRDNFIKIFHMKLWFRQRKRAKVREQV